MRIVIALGGNTPLRRGDPMTTEVQRQNVRIAAQAIAPLAAEHSVVVVHGMDASDAAGPSSPEAQEKKYLSVRQAAFIGVGAMVGAGIFALLGAAGEVAGAAISPGSPAAHLRIRSETGANLLMLVLAIVAAGAVFVTFVFTTLIHEPASIATLAGILQLSVALDYGWKRSRPSGPVPVQVGP